MASNGKQIKSKEREARLWTDDSSGQQELELIWSLQCLWKGTRTALEQGRQQGSNNAGAMIGLVVPLCSVRGLTACSSQSAVSHCAAPVHFIKIGREDALKSQRSDRGVNSSVVFTTN